MLPALAANKIECESFKNIITSGESEKLDKLPFELTYHYQQTSPGRQDPLGDLALMRLVYAMPKNLLWMVRKKNEKLENENREIMKYQKCASEVFSLSSFEAVEVESNEHDIIPLDEDNPGLTLPDKERLLEVFKEGALVIEGKVPPFYPTKLANMFNRVIQEEAKLGIKPQVGEFHKWSKGFIRKHYLEFFPFTTMSKVLLALARGDTARYMVTGEEQNLKNWILKQDENSITLDKMFRSSYQINKGNVYATLLTIENVLAQNWRDPERAELPLTKRLKLFTNTIGVDDRFGNWYHLFGIMLYGYVKNSFSAKIVGTLEGVGSDLLQAGKERQENIINRKAGKTGDLLHKWIKSGKWSKRETSKEFLKEDYYLERQTDFTRP